ncbi:MAG: hypothetical protein AABY15_03080 [Nanoarchaeota archaeon]
MKKSVKELHVSIGLPGSGKTTLFKQLAGNGYDRYHGQGHESCHIECDNYIIGKKPKTIDEFIKDKGYSFRKYTFLDGLFLTKESVSKILKSLEKEKIGVEKVIIHYWKSDRDACKWNDKGRRDKNSSITIDNAVVDSLDDIMKVSDEFKSIKFEKKKHDVIRKEGWKVFAEEHRLYIDDNGILKGESWCLGGTWGGYDGSTGTVSPSAAPEGFRELDDLLEEVAPNITFLQYKKIMNECVSNNEYSDGDYYGGRTYHNQQVLDVKALYSYLIEKELIQSYDK